MAISTREVVDFLMDRDNGFWLQVVSAGAGWARLDAAQRGTQEMDMAKASAHWRTIGLGLLVLGMVEDVLGKGWVDEEFRKMRERSRETEKEWGLDT